MSFWKPRFITCGFKMQGENLATTVLTGPGIVFIQSLPFHRFSRRIARYHLIAAWMPHSLFKQSVTFLPCSHQPFNSFSIRFHKMRGFWFCRAVTSTNMRENPKFYFQIFVFFFLAYVVILSSLILTENLWLCIFYFLYYTCFLNIT